MKNRHFLLVLTGSLALVCAVAMGATGSKGSTRAYKWKDNEGVVHYGDTIPPEFSDRAHQELNRQGVPVRESPRQMSPSEAAAAEKKETEEAQRRQHDKFLLTNYTKVSDIEERRDELVAQIDGQMELARGSIATIGQRLTGLQNRLGSFRPYSTAANARRVPDKLAEEVVRALSERRSISTQLRQREKERGEQLAIYATDIARFKELTANSVRRVP